MKKFLLINYWFFLLAPAIAQTAGSYNYRILADSIIQIQWSHEGMPHQEYIGDALVAKTHADFKPVTTESFSNGIGKLSGNIISLAIGSFVLPQIEGFDKEGVRGFRIQMENGKAWFGGGERTVPLDRRGQRIPLYNAPQYGYELDALQLNYSVPFVFCANGIGLLFDNPATGYMDFGKSSPGILEVGFVSGNVNMIVIPGATPDIILQRYAALTGRQPLPPRWALGNFMSRFGYRSQQEVLQTAADMDAAGFPIDAVVIDVFWFGNTIQHTLGNLAFVDKEKWPDPKGMIDKLKAKQVQTILVTEPFILQNTKNFVEAQPFLAKDSAGKPFMLSDFYFGYGGMLDLFRPDVRQWFFNFYKQFTDMGVAGWWGDLGEPEKHPPGVMHNLSSFGISRRMPADHVHNMYGHMWSKMLYDGWRKYYPGQRLFYLNRAGYAGSQRYSIFPWTGDVSRSWNGLKAQLYNLQSTSLSGVPYIHSDAGGFSMVDKDDQELYTRWLQMAIFTPILRPHGTNLGKDMQPEGTLGVASEPVYKNEPYRSIVKQLVEERYRLLPYNYNLAYEATSMGRPFMRPMFYYNMQDTGLLHASQQYMYGDAFLVRPITDAGASVYDLYLPNGLWYNYNNPAAVLQGSNSYQSLATDIGEMPVWVKGGSFVPYWAKKEGVNTSAYTKDAPVVMRYFPGTHSSGYRHFDDDGKNAKSLDNKNLYELNEWVAALSAGELMITVQAGQRMLCQILALPIQGDGKTIAGLAKKVKSISINGADKTSAVVYQKTGNQYWLQIPISAGGTSHKIVVVLE